ncbi:hypothetical protein BCR36DRAFT_585312 [Piromyces finnis]|uniref:GATA-type domain-containing protein n=1 Tax=Piromyces finnis TaxID=1754191 RepID=A0A1Y1V391_9FUNG|nr:hypothetical protein BCR36DRAFT_585312 [Piromyces finnis]|eukprot:ORX46169.1 hypothetical protein BCR36DRAFT_585312 [Piromyces finnis]
MTRSSRQRGEMVCTVCQTRTSPLWRRGDKGEVLCNACGLYHKHHKKPRPISLANSSSRSARRSNHQNNENKNQNQRFQNIYPNVMSRPNYPYTTTIAPALTKINATASNMSPTLQPMMFHSNTTTTPTLNNNGAMYNCSNNTNNASMSTLSPTFKMTTPSSMPIPIKKNIASSSISSPPLSQSFSPSPLMKISHNTNQNITNDRKLPMLPAPLAQKNNSEHYYNNLPSIVMKEEDSPTMNTIMDMDNRDNDMMIMSDDEGRYQQKNNKTSIASIMNSTDTPVNNYQHYHEHAIPTPLSVSPNNNYYMNHLEDNTNGYDNQDIEAAHLLISLRNEKVC